MGVGYNCFTGNFDLTGAGASASTVTSSTIPSVDNTIARFDGTSGTAIQGSTATISDAGVLTADNIIDSGLTASRAVVSNGSKQLTSATTTAAELDFLSGVTSAVQTQLNTNATAISDHIADAVDAHDASAISNVPSGNLAATDVQGALNELQSDIDSIPSYNEITVVNAQLGTSTSFATLSLAFASIPAGTTATERRQTYIVHIPSGTYDEDVTVACNNRSIIVVPHGVVSLGLMTGSAWGTGGTARTLTLANDGTATVGSIRSSFSIVQQAPLADVLTSNQANVSAFKVSGDVILTSAIGISSEFHFNGLEVFGNFDTSGYSGNCNVYTKFSRYRGTFGGTPTRLQNAYRVAFGGLATVGVYSMVNECIISAGFTTSSGTPDIQPSGFINTNFTGAFTGPASSFKLDSNTNFWFIANGGTLAGGATKTYQDGLATASESGILSSTDWSTFNSKQAAGNYITALTGDITASGPGSAAATLATVNGNVGSFGSATQVASVTVNAKGLVTAASNTSIQIAESQVTNLTTDLAAKQSNVLTDAHILVGNASNIATDVAVSGDVTLANTGAVTIGNNVVTNAKAAQMAAHTFKGNNTASTANASDLTATQLTAELNTFTDLLQGLVPASGGGTANFLRADGTFATPSGTGINQLTGDATAGPGSGSQALTLATVNGNVGSFGSSTSIPSFTVNAKGLITAASGNAVVAPAGTLSGTTLNATVVSSSLTSVGTITSGTWNGSVIDVARGGTNSSAALNNNRVIQSSGGAIVEAAAITAARALISDANGIPVHSAVTSTELGHVSGVTSAIQTQLNGKQTTTLADSNILVGNGSNVATAVAVTGDISISNAGVVAISTGVIVNADINASAAIDASKIADGTVSSTEFQFINSLTSNAQTQLDNRLLKAAGDINETSFTAADNQAVAANVTGLAFANATVRSFEVILSIVRGATFAQYKLNGVQGAASWYFSQTYLGDDAGLVFTITTGGQIQYTSSSTGDTALVKFRALTTSVA